MTAVAVAALMLAVGFRSSHSLDCAAAFGAELCVSASQSVAADVLTEVDSAGGSSDSADAVQLSCELVE